MENPTPFDLNEAIRRWQQNLGASPALKADNLEELASHLRASVQKLKADGLLEEEAFLIAARRLGERGALEREYAKVNTALNWSLPLLSFWVVAGIYFLQVTYSLVLGIVYLRRGLMMREALRLAAESANQSWRFRFSPGNDPLWLCVPTLTIVIVFVLILGTRLATGSWQGVRSFERPIRTMLVLVVLGLVLIVVPALFLWSDFPGYWFFLAEFFLPDTGLAPGGYLAGAAVNVALVLSMVLLARRGLRKMSPADGTLHNRATSNPR